MPPRFAATAVVAALLASACAGTTPSADSSESPSPVEAATAVATTPAGDTRAVRFDSADMTLVGDLRLPAGSGPHPGVVLVHGSGPLSRDSVVRGQLAMGFPEPVAIFADLADGLRAAGYAVLTYDKRTCGSFNGCADNGYPRPADDLTVDVFAADAQSAVAFLRSQAQVRDTAIAVVGHSQGATFVPPLLLDDPDLAAGVMLSAPYEPVDVLLAEQAATVDAVVAGMAQPPPGVQRQIAELRQLARSVRRLRSGGEPEGAALGGATVGFWRSWLRLSDGVPELARQAAQPLLVVTGAADTNVGATQTARWRRTLTGDRDRVAELECVSHALNCLGADDPLDVTPGGIADHVDPRVVAEIATFLDATVR